MRPWPAISLSGWLPEESYMQISFKRVKERKKQVQYAIRCHAAWVMDGSLCYLGRFIAAVRCPGFCKLGPCNTWANGFFCKRMRQQQQQQKKNDQITSFKVGYFWGHGGCRRGDTCKWCILQLTLRSSFCGSMDDDFHVAKWKIRRYVRWFTGRVNLDRTKSWRPKQRSSPELHARCVPNVCCFNNMHLLPFQEYNFKQTVDTSGLASSVNANAGQIFAMSFSPSVSSSSTYEPCENIGLLTTPTIRPS